MSPAANGSREGRSSRTNTRRKISKSCSYMCTLVFVISVYTGLRLLPLLIQNSITRLPIPALFSIPLLSFIHTSHIPIPRTQRPIRLRRPIPLRPVFERRSLHPRHRPHRVGGHVRRRRPPQRLQPQLGEVRLRLAAASSAGRGRGTAGGGAASARDGFRDAGGEPGDDGAEGGHAGTDDADADFDAAPDRGWGVGVCAFSLVPVLWGPVG